MSLDHLGGACHYLHCTERKPRVEKGHTESSRTRYGTPTSAHEFSLEPTSSEGGPGGEGVARPFPLSPGCDVGRCWAGGGRRRERRASRSPSCLNSEAPLGLRVLWASGLESLGRQRSRPLLPRNQPLRARPWDLWGNPGCGLLGGG